MFKNLMFCLCGFTSLSCWSTEVDFGLGLGTQYGGVGGQLIIDQQQTKYFIALGIPGYSIGMKSVISDHQHHSWGLNAGVIDGIFSSDTQFAGVTYNYHFDGFENDGWELGLVAFYYREKEHKRLFSHIVDEEETGVGISFNLGYSF
ncbi:hypothetical protein [Psychrobium sp. 1_MG-2023]|uniref:hypothetical protein n=1 Tax=Psychrobium sp. 1_MG-2023 TaxID=3062624 RepID=UPI00129190E9|nr:hypothetical protein [Psychrobium sp. 1_MG-2023]MDP2560809.1 hypothetical protein [Psychrobium sp. 1_MG-2023]